MQFFLFLQQLVYLLSSFTTKKQLIRRINIQTVDNVIYCKAYSLLFADLLPGLDAIGLPISFHDPELSLQFGDL